MQSFVFHWELILKFSTWSTLQVLNYLNNRLLFNNPKNIIHVYVFFNRESFCTSTKSTCGSFIHRTIKYSPDRPTIFIGWESCIYNISLQTKAYQEGSTVRLFLHLFLYSFLHQKVNDMIIDLSQILWYVELLRKKIIKQIKQLSRVGHLLFISI